MMRMALGVWVAANGVSLLLGSAGGCGAPPVFGSSQTQSAPPHDGAPDPAARSAPSAVAAQEMPPGEIGRAAPGAVLGAREAASSGVLFGVTDGEIGLLGDDRDQASGRPYGMGTLGQRPPSTKVEMGDLHCSRSDLDRNVVRRHLRSRTPQLRACYETLRRAKPNMQGAVAVELTINRDGTVSGVRARGLDPELEACWANVIRAVVFPKPPRGRAMRCSVPYELVPPDPAP